MYTYKFEIENDNYLFSNIGEQYKQKASQKHTPVFFEIQSIQQETHTPIPSLHMVTLKNISPYLFFTWIGHT